jgi:vitamin B12 transporter
MHVSRLWRLAAACRFVAPTSLLFFAFSVALASADVSGTIVDQSGHVVPRASVRTIDRSGATSTRGFADELGRFELKTSSTDCRVEATLTGFQPATLPCSGQPLHLVLLVAPVEETTIVSATRTDAPTSQVGASATVFTSDDLERRQTPLLADLLASTPGAMIVRSGGPGALTSLFVRGGESDYNKVLLDGVPLNEPGGTFYLSNLTTEDIERVEILRGAYSSLFGSDAMGSVIQLFTRRGNGAAARPHFTGQIDGGTYSTVHANAAVSGASRRFDYHLGAARFDTDNRVPNSGLENNTLSGNLGISIAGRASLRFLGRTEREHVGTPGTTAYGRPDLDAFFERRDDVFSVSFDDQATRTVRQRASYSLASSNQRSTNLIADPDYTATFQGHVALFPSSDFLNDSRTDFDRHHAGYQADWRLGNIAAGGDQLLTVLADWDGERATQNDLLGAFTTRNSRNNAGVAAQYQISWDRVFVTAGGRIEHNGNFGTAAVPRGTIVFVAHRSAGIFGDTQIKASGGSGIKEPSMLESFSLSPYALGNPDLRPERSRSFEVGLEQRAVHDRAKFDIAYFDNRFRDIVTVITTNPSTFEGRYANVGLTRARGLETGVQLAPIAGVSVRGGYTLLDSTILESASPDHPLFGIGQEAFRRPRHSGYVGAALAWKRLDGDINGVVIGEFLDSDFGLFNPPLVRNPGHTTWDGRLAVRLTPQLTGTLAIDNLTDQDYSEPFGYQALRRAVRAGIRVAF